eukprot:COSAG01_NODE_8568_length_2737_cov_4.139121_2_plen_56_part_00
MQPNPQARTRGGDLLEAAGGRGQQRMLSSTTRSASFAPAAAASANPRKMTMTISG